MQHSILLSATLEKAILAKARETNEITGDTYEQYRANKGSKPVVKPKTTRIEVADYDLFGLDESGEVVTYSDDSAEDDEEKDKDDGDDEEEDGGDDPKDGKDPAEGHGEDV